MSYEKKIIGSILSNYKLIDMFNIVPEMFSEEYKSIVSSCMTEKNMGFDSFDGSAFDKKKLEYLENILSERSSDRNFEHYLRLHSEEKKKIELTELFKTLTEKMHDKGVMVNDIINDIYANVSNIKANSHAIDDIYNPDDICKIIDKFKTGEIKNVSNIKYGYELLDKYALGMHPKQITMLVAKTGTGKSSFSINVLKNVAIEQGHKIMYLSNEMDVVRTTKRLQACVAGIDTNNFGQLNKTQEYIYDAAKERVRKGNFILTGNMPKTIADAALLIRRNNVDKQLKVVIYDYLGETKSDNTKGLKEWEKLTMYTQQLLEIAKEQDLHIIILNQFSKESEKHEGFKARGATLGGSEILHKVDRFFYFDYDDSIGKYVLSIEKNRDGDCKKIIYDFYKNTQRIEERGLYDETAEVEKKSDVPF